MRVAPFEPDVHVEQAIEVLQRVWDVDPEYPPRRTTTRSPNSLKQWLEDEGELFRFAAVVDGAVAGHILVAEAHGYLVEHLAGAGYQYSEAGVVEIGKFFVDPRCQRLGIGSALLGAAVDAAWGSGRQPALAVLAPSAAARRLYAASGMRDLGTFLGKDGVNVVFVDERAPATETLSTRVPDRHSAGTK